jgi:hypothetical protein
MTQRKVLKMGAMRHAARLAGMLLAAAVTLTAGTVLNFDDQPTAPSGISGVDLTNQYASQGVVFNSIDASQSFKFNITPASSPNYASPFFNGGSPGTFAFVDPADPAQNAFVDTVSFTLLGLTATTAHPGFFSGATIDALDLNGDVIPGETQIISATSVTTSNLTLTFTGEVHEIRFTQTAGTSGLLPFDDLTFGAVMTPEPATFGLIGAALVLAGCVRRVRR